MANFKQLLTNFMDGSGTKYTDIDEHAIAVRFNADNTQTITIIVVFEDPEDGKVSIQSVDLGTFKDDDRFTKALILCNECNGKYRWVKFNIDDDRNVIIRLDAIVDESSVGEEVEELVHRMASIIDDVYPAFMRVRYV